MAESEVLIVKPMTYMNRSGAAVHDIVVRDEVLGEQLIVVHDDLDLPAGSVRVKVGGGHGGHNGLRSILAEADAGEFVRLRLGVGRSERIADAADWVLQPIAADQWPDIERQIEHATDALEVVLERGPGAAMNQFNWRPKAVVPNAASPQKAKA